MNLISFHRFKFRQMIYLGVPSVLVSRTIYTVKGGKISSKSNINPVVRVASQLLRKLCSGIASRLRSRRAKPVVLT